MAKRIPKSTEPAGSDYAVGYGKPPKDSQFRKGESGNPKGRPKGAKNLASALEAELATRITIIENGGRRSITKLEAAVKQVANKAASGDLRALQLLSMLLQSSPPADPAGPLATEMDEQVKQDLLKRIQQIAKETNHEEL